MDDFNEMIKTTVNIIKTVEYVLGDNSWKYWLFGMSKLEVFILLLKSQLQIRDVLLGVNKSIVIMWSKFTWHVLFLNFWSSFD